SAGGGATQVTSNTVDVLLTSITGNIQVNTLGGNDTLSVSFSGGPLGKLIVFDGGAGADTLVGPDATETWNIIQPGSGNITGLVSSFTNIENLTGGSGSDSFVFANAGSVSGAINGGVSSDVLDYSAVGS